MRHWRRYTAMRQVGLGPQRHHCVLLCCFGLCCCVMFSACSQDEDVCVALEYMRKLAPAAAQPAPPTLKALFAISVQAAGNFSHFPELLQLPACSQLQPQDWLDVLAHCLDMCRSLPPFVMSLPAAQQMDSGAVLQLLQQAAQLQASAVVPQLVVLPAAAQLAKHELMQLLSELVQQGDVQGAGCLFKLPGAQMLTGKHFQRLRNKAVRAQQWSCTLWLQRQPQLAELQWRDMQVPRLQPLVLTAAQEGDMTAVLALLQLPKASRLQPEHVTALVAALLGERRCTGDSSASKQTAKAEQTAALTGCLACLCELRAVRKLQSPDVLQMLQAGMQHKQGLGVSNFARLPAAQQLTTAELWPLLVKLLLGGPCHAGWLEFLRLPGLQHMDADRICAALCVWIRDRRAADVEQLVHMMLQLPAASYITAAQIAGLAQLACKGSHSTTAAVQWLLQLPNAQALSEAQVKPWLRDAVIRCRYSGLGAALGRIPAVAASADAELQLHVRLLQSAPRPGDDEVQIVV